jgi:hypothetical protein
MSNLTPLQIKALVHAKDRLSLTSKYDMQNAIMNELRSVVGNDHTLYQRVYDAVSNATKDFEDGKNEAKSWISSVIESSKP